ncbi:unknown [[Mannheimia] succiniciproducens MBEL55E]|uniref:Uncharacterized protein n=1 Tax=Mannheimia succiniciproducens (strain KCTC 0769BP / MBEL55E) TaxID=221988 RepID=Q65QQ4_MANSM|nr:unknown [[Mannheimia] succiniciproducens MBEL55E]
MEKSFAEFAIVQAFIAKFLQKPTVCPFNAKMPSVTQFQTAFQSG